MPKWIHIGCTAFDPTNIEHKSYYRQLLTIHFCKGSDPLNHTQSKAIQSNSPEKNAKNHV